LKEAAIIAASFFVIFIMKYLLLTGCLLYFGTIAAQPSPSHNLSFDHLATRWDEAIPLGNGWLGALVWQKQEKLRFSLDRVDLWDDRPMPKIDQLKFNWVVDRVQHNDYDTVQKIGDEPYEKYPAPSKIPGAALEFNIGALGKIKNVSLDIATAICHIQWEQGTTLETYVSAQTNYGVFVFRNLPEEIPLNLIAPPYQSTSPGKNNNSVAGQGLASLGYAPGKLSKGVQFIRYYQPGYGKTAYEVIVKMKYQDHEFRGSWTINKINGNRSTIKTVTVTDTSRDNHIQWWRDYWSRSSISVPDSLLERQYYLEMYKFGSVTRSNTPPISLQAIWTADNGNLPPWKGDLHHDLNTELSYWPGYTSNHLNLTASFSNWMWQVKAENEKWTRSYFQAGGLNVPGVTTISGKPMGGWIQYSMSPTTVAWLSHHMFLQWKYSMDDQFLKQRCVPYFEAADTYLNKILVWDIGVHAYFLPLSSSPEYHDNSIKAWFKNYTNYDLSLIRSMYGNLASLYRAQGKKDSLSMKAYLNFFPQLDENNTGLTIAPGQNLDESHRHHAHLMAIYPLGLLSPDDSAQQVTIDKSLRWLEKIGTREWCGYSFSWAACLYARAKEADHAVKQLQIFAAAFCSPNSFHLNGDQLGGKYSSFTYRPFTLEGNFAFAQGVHELLLQSYQGYIEVFPAVPASWKDVSFKTLRAEGAFLISAKKEGGVVASITVTATAGGKLLLKLPFKTWIITGIDPGVVTVNDGIASTVLAKGQTITINNGYE